MAVCPRLGTLSNGDAEAAGGALLALPGRGSGPLPRLRRRGRGREDAGVRLVRRREAVERPDVRRELPTRARVKGDAAGLGLKERRRHVRLARGLGGPDRRLAGAVRISLSHAFPPAVAPGTTDATAGRR